jgi:hypothetical protein
MKSVMARSYAVPVGPELEVSASPGQLSVTRDEKPEGARDGTGAVACAGSNRF